MVEEEGGTGRETRPLPVHRQQNHHERCRGARRERAGRLYQLEHLERHDPDQQPAPITIGASLSLDSSPNDPFLADGQAFQKGYKLWAKDVNDHGGLLGRQVKLNILDDGSSPNQVVTNYQTLFGKDHVDLAFGPFSSLLSGPASAVAARYGMAFVEGAGGAPSVFDTMSTRPTTTRST